LATSKKRRDREFIRRSKAAKKGWVTRRAKQTLKKSASNQKKKIQNAQLGVSKRKRRVIPALDLSWKSREELEEIVRKQRIEIERYELTKDWVDAMPPEYLHHDGTIAVQPSRARHLGAVTTEARRILRSAWKKGENAFHRAAVVIAEQLELPVREIYTLHYSP